MAVGLRLAELAELATPARLQKLRRGMVPAAAVLAFFVFLLATFPYDMIGHRIEAEAARAGVELTIGSIGGRGLIGVRARDVRARVPGAPGEPVTELRFDRVDVSPDLFALLFRRTSFGFALQAYGSSAKGHAALSSDPKLGFFAQAHKFSSALGSGSVLAPAKNLADMRAIVTNSLVDGVLSILFAGLIIVVILDATRVCIATLSSPTPPRGSETPFVESRIQTPAGLFDRDTDHDHLITAT